MFRDEKTDIERCGCKRRESATRYNSLLANMFRTLFITVLVLLISPIVSTAQWNGWDWQKVSLPAPYDNGYYLGIYFLPSNSNVGWVCGYNGAVLRTRDGGKTWRGTVISNAPQLESIIFLNDNVGYCSGTSQFSPGSGGVYKSVDGGASWQEITPLVIVGGVLQRAQVWGCNFINERVGVVVGGGCGGEVQTFFRTDDGGASWSLFTAGYPNSGLSHPRMVQENGLCYASSSGAIWRSTDGGRTWGVHGTTGPAYWQENLKFINNSFCVATAGTSCIGGTDAAGDIRFSTDGGRSFSLFRIGQAMFGTFMLNDSTAWAAGFERSVYRTSDYGKTWTPYRCGLEPGSDFDDIFFINDTNGFVVGDGIYRTVRPQSAPAITVTGDTVFCEGGAVRLTAAPGFSEYRWSNGATTSSINATKSGIYNVAVRKGTDCPLVSNGVRVTVLPAPKPGLLSSRSNNNLCFNDSLILRTQGAFRSVRWSTGDSTASIIVRTAGKYSVVVVDTNGCTGADSVEVTGGVKIVPRLSRSGVFRFCEGDSLVLRAQDGFSFYKWSNASTGSSIVVRADGTYSVRVTDKFGCEWDSDTISVAVDTNPIQITGLPGSKLVIDSTRPHELRCDSLRVRNNGSTVLTISVARLLRNIEFSVPQSQLSMVLQPQEERSLAVCYQPSQLHRQLDTLVIGNYCNRVIIVESVGVPDSYVSTSRCDVPLTGITEAINTNGLFVYPVYPQPASDVVTMRVRHVNGDKPESITATDMLGNRIQLPIVSTIRLGQSGGLVLEELAVDVGGLSPGTYALQVHTIHHTASHLLQIVR